MSPVVQTPLIFEGGMGTSLYMSNDVTRGVVHMLNCGLMNEWKSLVLISECLSYMLHPTVSWSPVSTVDCGAEEIHARAPNCAFSQFGARARISPAQQSVAEFGDHSRSTGAHLFSVSQLSRCFYVPSREHRFNSLQIL